MWHYTSTELDANVRKTQKNVFELIVRYFFSFKNNWHIVVTTDGRIEFLNSNPIHTSLKVFQDIKEFVTCF